MRRRVKSASSDCPGGRSCSRLASEALLKSPLSLVLLGGFEARWGSGAPLSLANNKAQALLAYLAVRPGRRHPRDKLATLLWPGTGDEHARQSLRQALVTLRQAIGTREILIADHQDVVVEGAGLDVDVVRFEGLIGQRSAEALEAAAALYQGELLEGIRVKEPPFEEWLLGERQRLRELALEGLGRLLTLQLGSGPVTPAIGTAMRILTLDPAQEAVHRELMRLFERQGRRGEALRQYRVCVDALQRELGVEPEAETRRLYQDIVRATPVPLPRAAGILPAGEATSPSSAEARASAWESAPPVGRDSELARMGRALDGIEQGKGGLVVVLGEAGVGKSTLLEALEIEARRRGIRCHAGRSYLSEQVLPFAPWIEMLRAADVVGNPQVLACLGQGCVEDLGRLIPDLNAGSSERAGDGGGPQRIFEAVVRLVSCLAAEQPRLITLEDVHWADEMSLRLLAFVARRIRSQRALVVATVREEELTGGSILSRVVDELGADPHVERMTLPPLSREHTAMLVRSHARTDTAEDVVARLAERLFAASGGNPFMVVETMRAIADGTAAQTSTGLPLSDRVRQVIAARLDRFGERSRGLLATASVIGREFDFALVRAASGLDEVAAAEEIEAFVRGRVLRVVGERFDFVHDQLRDVVYQQLLPPRRKLLHAAIARAIEEIHSATLGEHVERLAHHAFRGGLWDRAARYGRRAGSIAAERSASSQAAACFDQALEALARLPETRETLQQAIELRELRSSHDFALGDRNAYLKRVDEALALAERLGDERWLARVLALQSNALWFAGDNRRALDAAVRAAALAERAGDVVPLIRASLNLGLICNTLGDFDRGARELEKTAQLLSGELERERLGRTLYPAVTARGELSRAQAELGQFDAALDTVREALRIAEALHHSTTLLVARVDVCHVLVCRGDFRDVIPQAEACLLAGREAGQPVFGGSAAGMLGYAQAMTGRLADGIVLLREAVEQAATGRRTREAIFTTYLSEALLAAGQVSEASELGARALALSQERLERATEARALYVLGEIAARGAGGDPVMAERHYREALGLAAELKVRPLVGQCHLGLARLERRARAREGWRQHLATATATFHELGMSFWLEQADAEAAAEW
jgi:DNA-binding SARP family transcriptional activator/tetratricopeptide (TPR) repeat protein